MTRLELGIVGLFGAIIMIMGSTLWAMWDLPGRMEKSQEQGIVQMLEKMKSNQGIIMDKLDRK